jgi:hypothetical protein
MNTARRLQIAWVLALFALFPLAGVIFDVLLDWDTTSSAFKPITGFLIVLFAGCFGISLSIALDRDLDDVPWAKLGYFLLFLVLGMGVVWARNIV